MRVPLFITILLSVSLLTAISQPSREITKTIPFKSGGLLVIDTYKGSITITTHDKPQVEVYVKIESDDADSRDAARDVEDTEIEIHSTDKEVRLHTNYRNVERNNYHNFWDWITDPHETSNSLPLVHYTIKMPRTTELRIKDYKSESHIEGLTSCLTLNTYKGTVEVFDLEGGIDLETYKGDVRISFAMLKNDSHFETYKGKISVSIPQRTSFELQTDFERRVNFSTDFDVETHERDRKHHHYDYSGKINGGGPMLEFKSDKGEIRLRSK
ncbi:MAG: DUF4097 family beta strand repeat-containing protein [Bacteroidota bacterium]|jgi:hypothetical protein